MGNSNVNPKITMTDTYLYKYLYSLELFYAISDAWSTCKDYGNNDKIRCSKIMLWSYDYDYDWTFARSKIIKSNAIPIIV